MIIVEGIDNSGKTTIAKHIAETLGIDYVHNTIIPRGSPNEDLSEWIMFIEESLMNPFTRVFDRHPILSERIYGPALRGRNLLATTDYFSTLMEKAPIIVYACLPIEQVVETFDERPQLSRVLENLPTLIEAYDRLMVEIENYGIEVYYYDHTLPLAFEYCLKWIDEQTYPRRAYLD